MAEIPVTKKSSSSWWMWLIGLLLLAALVWFLYGALTEDRSETAATPTTTATTAPAPTSSASPATPPQTGAAPGLSAAPATATGETITDSGAYASAGDKLSLVGRRVEIVNARVARVVGPKTFTLESGSEEFYVMVEGDLSKGVGTQGQIDKGSVLNVKGSFRRLTADEIGDVSDNRFRDLTEQERETLRKRQVYLHATEFSKIN